MKIIPALDLMGGNVVRLTKGKLNTQQKYSAFGIPEQIAKKWSLEGAEILHIIDLDSVFNYGNNLPIIKNIAEEVKTPIQLGGGIRTLEKARTLLDNIAYRVIIGSMALSIPNNVIQLIDEYGPERVAVALDYQNNIVMKNGWVKGSNQTLKKTFLNHLSNGVKWFLVTSIDLDGTLDGPDIETISTLAKNRNSNIMAAGGIGSLNHISMVKKTGAKALVIGKALYEGLFSLKEAIQQAGGVY